MQEDKRGKMGNRKNHIQQVRNVLFRKSFKVAVFGSARIKPGHVAYEKVHSLAKMIGEEGMDLVTGGGPGLMEAANNGYSEGKRSKDAKSIGLSINVENEKIKSHADIEQKFTKFSDRLDNFIVLANAIVVAPGGIGTMLELFYTWQLLQVNKIRHIPVILMGDMWSDLMKWIKNNPVKQGFIGSEDLELVHVAKNAKEAMAIIEKEFEKYKKNS